MNTRKSIPTFEEYSVVQYPANVKVGFGKLNKDAGMFYTFNALGYSNSSDFEMTGPKGAIYDGSIQNRVQNAVINLVGGKTKNKSLDREIGAYLSENVYILTEEQHQKIISGLKSKGFKEHPILGTDAFEGTVNNEAELNSVIEIFLNR